MNWTVRDPNPSGGERYSLILAPWPSQPLYNGYRRSFSRVKRPQRGVDRSSRSSAQVKNEQSYTATPLYTYVASYGETFYLFLDGKGRGGGANGKMCFVISKYLAPQQNKGQWLGSERFTDQISVGTRFSAHEQTCPRAHPASCTKGNAAGVWH